MIKRLILGDGLLGTELIRQTGWDYISRKKDGIDFSNIDSYKDHLFGYDEIINCIACTNTYDENKEENWNTNYKGVANLVDLCNILGKKIIHISTDYLYTYSKVGATENDVPVHCKNWYGYTKLLADGYVQLKSNNFLLLRNTHKKNPFPHENAWVNQIGNFDYVDIITKYIVKLINKNAVGIYNVGTDVKTIYQLAKKTNKDVKLTYSMIDETAPTNVIMDVSKLEMFLGDE